MVGTADLHGKPAAWITIAPPGRGDGAVATLAGVLTYVGADVDPALCPRLPVLSDDIGADGLVTNESFRTGARAALTGLCVRSAHIPR
ncbi:hypothetical protein [Nocardia paucivorans]|uniref:hypothetical protein n=1 Tax=Nocardia paucivorans TaxID=114259 RepID=UPI001FE0836D|nr:hypothetical protein [Nocardia paucivorans]